MSKTDELIANLGRSAQPVRPASSPMRMLAGWILVTLVSTALYILFVAPRDDWGIQLQSPLYWVEIVDLLAVILTSALAAVWLCYPDLRQKPKVLFIPLLPAVIYAGIMIYRAFHPETMAHPAPGEEGGIQCAICITALSLVPGFWMFRIIRENATTRPYTAGAVSLLAASSVGFLALRIVEREDSVLHLLEWHLMPVLVLAAIGGFIGKKLLKW